MNEKQQSEYEWWKLAINVYFSNGTGNTDFSFNKHAQYYFQQLQFKIWRLFLLLAILFAGK